MLKEKHILMLFMIQLSLYCANGGYESYSSWNKI